MIFWLKVFQVTKKNLQLNAPLLIFTNSSACTHVFFPSLLWSMPASHKIVLHASGAKLTSFVAFSKAQSNYIVVFLFKVLHKSIDNFEILLCCRSSAFFLCSANTSKWAAQPKCASVFSITIFLSCSLLPVSPVFKMCLFFVNQIRATI